MADDADAVDFFLDFGADFFQFGNEGLQVFRNGILYEDIALGHGRADHESTRFDAVGDDGVIGAMQFLDAFDADDVGAGTADVGAHTVEVRCQIDDFRFFCGIFQDRLTVGHGCSHEDIFRSADAGEIEIDLSPFEAIRCRRFDVSVFQVDDGSHGFKSLEVQVDRTGTDGAAAGQGNLGPPLAGQ